MKPVLNVILADDDEDDRALFAEALREIVPELQFTTVADGDELIKLLNGSNSIRPDLIFLDLNMPLKSGFDCLVEIKHEPKLREIPVIIISTSNDSRHVEQVYQGSADYYICKPDSFEKLKKVITISLSLGLQKGHRRVSKDFFMLNYLLE